MDIVYWSKAGTEGGKSKVPRSEKVAEEILEALIEGEAQLKVGKKLKVGVTSNPTKRSYSHGYLVVDQWDEGEFRMVKLRRGPWAFMHVIYQTNSLAEVQRVEFNLIEHARAWAGIDLSVNRISGGGGNFCPRGPYYVYLLQEKP